MHNFSYGSVYDSNSLSSQSQRPSRADSDKDHGQDEYSSKDYLTPDNTITDSTRVSAKPKPESFISQITFEEFDTVFTNCTGSYDRKHLSRPNINALQHDASRRYNQLSDDLEDYANHNELYEELVKLGGKAPTSSDERKIQEVSQKRLMEINKGIREVVMARKLWKEISRLIGQMETIREQENWC